LGKVLLAFDAGDKSMEALYVAAYPPACGPAPACPDGAATCRRRAPDPQAARRYLQKNGTQAEFHERQGETAAAILAQAEELAADLIILGSYGQWAADGSPGREHGGRGAAGSRVPVLICI
jgi:nucleotide-binding universal stress UspA family protein